MHLFIVASAAVEIMVNEIYSFDMLHKPLIGGVAFNV